MIDLLADGNFPFTVAIVIMLMIFVLEIVSLVLGLSISTAIDSLIPDFDIPGIDVADADLSAASGPLSHIFGWLQIGRVPILILVILFLVSFGLSGLILQTTLQSSLGIMLPPGIAAIPATVLGILGMSRIGAWIGRILPKDESQAARRSELIGAVATLVGDNARPSDPVEAKARDLRGQTHYFLAEPALSGVVMRKGDKGTILRRMENGVYQLTTKPDTQNQKGA